VPSYTIDPLTVDQPPAPAGDMVRIISSKTDRPSRLPLLLSLIAVILGAAALAVSVAVVPGTPVGSARLADSAVDSRHIRDGSVSAADLAKDTVRQGPAGPQGSPGPQGSRGPRGPRGAAGSVKLDYRASSADASDGEASATVSCPRGTQVVGGGAVVAGQGGVITMSGPRGTSGWRATALARRASQKDGWSLEVTAVCAK
jgi:hypothetical protein